MHSRGTAVALLAAAALATSTAVTHAQAGLSLEAFLSRIHQARALAAQAARAPSPERMQEVRLTLGLPAIVDLPARSLTFRSDPFLDRLKGARGEDFSAAVTHLDALAAAARDAAGSAAADPRAVRSALARAYVGVRARPGLFERARGSVLTFIGDLIDRLSNVRSVTGALAWAVVAALLATALLALRRIGFVPQRALPNRRRSDPLAVNWGRLEGEALARGDLTEAIRYRFRALVATLDARGVLTESPSVTAGECRHAVFSAIPSAYPVVERATAIFERVLYGRAAPVAGDVEILRRAEAEVLAA